MNSDIGIQKGLSVPDAQMLIKIAELFDVSVSDLLGEKIESDKDISDIALQLSKVNEELVIKNKRSKKIWKLVKIFLVVIVIWNLLMVIIGIISSVQYGEIKSTDIQEIVEE